MNNSQQVCLDEQTGKSTDRAIFLTRSDLRDLGIRVSASTLIRWQNAGKFPKVVHLGGTKCVWPKDQVMRWCDQCVKDAKNFTYADF